MAADKNPSNPYREGAEVSIDITVTTGNEVAGHEISRYHGIVRGIVVRSPSIGSSFIGGLKQMVGGNISEYSDVCEAARHDAYQLMLAHTRELGANAIIGMRYDATEFIQGATEVLAYGTAVTIDRKI